MAEVLARIVPASLANRETQACILAGLCFVGSWVLITKIIQFVFSMMLPFVMIAAFLTLAPNWTNAVISEIIPQCMLILQGNFKRLLEYVGSKRAKA